jgi:hypothetical protein
MAGILQSNAVTPGHPAIWITDGVIADGGPIPYSSKVLASLIGADFNNANNDQPILLPSLLNAFQLTGIIVANASVSLSVAVGGFYPQVSQGGSAIVSAGQTYSALTSSALLLNATLTAYAQAQYFTRTQLANWAIYLNLTTPQGSVATANVYLLGVQLA